MSCSASNSFFFLPKDYKILCRLAISSYAPLRSQPGNYTAYFICQLFLRPVQPEVCGRITHVVVVPRSIPQIAVTSTLQSNWRVWPGAHGHARIIYPSEVGRTAIGKVVGTVRSRGPPSDPQSNEMDGPVQRLGWTQDRMMPCALDTVDAIGRSAGRCCKDPSGYWFSTRNPLTVQTISLDIGT